MSPRATWDEVDADLIGGVPVLTARRTRLYDGPP
jgi:hypothetical protein